MTDFFAIFILLAPALLVIGVVRLLGVEQWWGILLAGMAGGAAAGAFLASAASAMATAVSNTAALLRGGFIGAVAGLAAGLLVLGLGRVVAAWQQRR